MNEDITNLKETITNIIKDNNKMKETINRISFWEKNMERDYLEI